MVSLPVLTLFYSWGIMDLGEGLGEKRNVHGINLPTNIVCYRPQYLQWPKESVMQDIKSGGH